MGWLRPGGRRRVRTPTLLQMEATECGAAALGSVLGYLGRFVSLAELRLACGVSRDGTKASNMLKAARQYGLNAKGLCVEPEGLRSLPLPVVVFWNFNHFVVVEGFRGDRVYLNDPAVGPRTVSAEEFDESFTGVVLAFEPGPDFRKGGQRRRLAAGLRTRLSGSEIALVYVVLVSLALVVPGLVIPTFTRVFVDEILVGGMQDWLMPLLLGMAMAAAMRAGLTGLQQHYLLRLETKLALSTSSQFFWHVLRLPMEFFTQRYGGEIGARVVINDRVAQLLSGRLATTAVSLVTLVFFAALMFHYDVVLTLVGIGVAVLNVAAMQYVARQRVDKSHRLLQESGKLVGTTMAGLQTIETLKATGAEADFFARWSGQFAKVINVRQALHVSTLFLSAVPSLLTGLNTVAILTVGTLRVMDGYLTIGMLVAFQSLMASFLGPVEDLVGMGGALQEAEGDMNRLDDVLRYEADPALDSDGRSGAASSAAAKLSGHLELRHITFGYSRLAPPFITDLNLTLKPGARIALVGATGSGKSTVARIVCGLYKPWEGEILLGGRRRGLIPRSLLSNSLAMVDQDIFLFEGTIRDNLTLWDRGVPEHDLIQAAKDACIHEDVATRLGGYDGHVEEGGMNFSGGQRQRLEIARALVGNPTLLVLDEAASALDPLVEKAIDDRVRARGCACLVIAHRLSTTRDCDEIIVLDQGRVIQRGSHEELIHTDGPYRQLISAEG